MQLSRRLSAIAEFVTEGNRVADVGCDHGYLPVSLLLDRKIPSAIAMDVRKGPLARAMEHIQQYGLEDYIETRLSDGLEALRPGEADTLILAGMGGPLMERILEKDAAVRDSLQELILQPQSDIGHFRRFLGDVGYEIVQEAAVLEEGKFYFLMKAVRGTMENWTEADYAFGRYLLEEKNPVLQKYLLREQEIRDRIRASLEAGGSPAARERLTEVEEEERLIQAALKRYEMQ